MKGNDIEYLLTESDFEILKGIKDNIVSSCKKCGGSGIKAVEAKDKDSAWKTSRECRCIKKFRKYKSYYKSRIPEVYWNVTEENFYGDKSARKVISKYIDNLNNARANGLGFFIYGTNGNGKTSLANIILKEALAEDYSALYVTLQGLLNMIISSFGDDNRSDKVRSLVCNVDFLVIDEIGKEHLKVNKESGTVFGISEFEQVLRVREGYKKSNILVSNKTPKEVEAKYKESIGSLISGDMHQLEVIGIDTRKSVKSKSWASRLEGK